MTNWQKEIDAIIRALHAAPGIAVLSAGLAPGKVAAAEKRFGLSFPEDMRYFVERIVIVRPGFPNWHDLDSPELSRLIRKPISNLLDEVAPPYFYWEDAYGPRPDSLSHAISKAEDFLSRVPQLIPVGGNIYVAPSSRAPSRAFSVWGSDIAEAGTFAYGLVRVLRSLSTAGFPLALEPSEDCDQVVEFWSSLVE